MMFGFAAKALTENSRRQRNVFMDGERRGGALITLYKAPELTVHFKNPGFLADESRAPRLRCPVPAAL